MKKKDMAFIFIVVLILVYFFSPTGNRMINNLILSVTKTTEESISGVGTTSIKEITSNDSRKNLKKYNNITIQGTADLCDGGTGYKSSDCIKDSEENWIEVRNCDIPVFMNEKVKLWGSIEFKKKEVGKTFKKEYYFNCWKKKELEN